MAWAGARGSRGAMRELAYKNICFLGFARAVRSFGRADDVATLVHGTFLRLVNLKTVIKLSEGHFQMSAHRPTASTTRICCLSNCNIFVAVPIRQRSADRCGAGPPSCPPALPGPAAHRVLRVKVTPACTKSASNPRSRRESGRAPTSAPSCSPRRARVPSVHTLPELMNE